MLITCLWKDFAVIYKFEKYFISQTFNENRTMEYTLDLGWKLLSILPKEELDRVDTDMLNKHYKAEYAEEFNRW